MPLRRRLALVAAAAVAVAVALAALVSYLVVRGQLRGQIDSALQGQATLNEQGPRPPGSDLPGPPPDAGGQAPYTQFVAADGTVLGLRGGIGLPVTATTRSVAAGTADDQLTDATVQGSDMRILAFHANAALPGGQIVPVAVEIARPLGPVNRVLAHLRLVLLFVFAGGIALAAALARLAAASVIRPLAQVASTAQTIGETDDLSLRLDVRSEDEVGQLAARFNGMLDSLEHSRAALDESVRAQRQLVADASHELRTPVTSLRTNIEVLLMSGELADEERDRLLSDVVEQSEELTALVSGLIELARGDQPAGAAEDVRLDGVVAESLARARRNAPTITFEATLAPVVVDAVAERLERAVNNLLDNAVRHSPPQGVVEVRVDPGGVTVRDHGPGIPADELPYVFDRFFRGEAARSSPGSGLGLAIVRQVAEQHGGSVSARNAPDGGAVFRLALPGAPATDDAPERAAQPGVGLAS